jgi:periplasmic protein TonB
MGYAALLFCPDDKTARTVTQVLSELEFAVEACSEPFAAVKKLMGQHFDAVVVDCDNEQNATLIFKSARNSTSNQTSLAVAVVEGQAGVAKAFRIGANLVLTKPINIEQAKGTLRVARGLLRKGEPAKPATPAATAASADAAPSKTPAAKPISDTKAPVVAAPSPMTPEPPATPTSAPTPNWPMAETAASKWTAQDDDLLDIDGSASQKAPAIEAKAVPAAPMPTSSSGAASAPAPAKERAESDLFEKPAAVTAPAPTPEKIETNDAAPFVGSAPSFTFGGANVEVQAASGSKKVVFGIAAALVLGAAYFGWTHFHSSTAESKAAEQSSPTSQVTATPQGLAKPTGAQPVPSKPSAIPETKPSASAAPDNMSHSNNTDQSDLTDDSDTSSKTAEEEKPAPAPLIVKGGKAASHAKSTASDAAPPVIGLATPGASAPPPDLIPMASPTLRPSLQTLNVSQGVSQGLLIKKVPPAYPANALRMHIEGSVELIATISKEGAITHIKVISGETQLTKAATDAVKQWKYKPYLLNGEPVEIQTQVTINFKLPR